jgi:uncharacterized membrane protein YbaN (DUF454 family)
MPPGTPLVTPPMRRHALRIARLSVGSLLIVVGIIGGFIPVLQGWIFVLGGLSLLAQESERARLLLERVRDRFQSPPSG